MESGPKQGLKCNFKIVGALRIPGPPVTIRGPLSVLQRPPVFLFSRYVDQIQIHLLRSRGYKTIFPALERAFR